ncbi:MAG TPA: diguanylate cyclase [Phycisphaerae bacterium]|nr:diguanylate cyclase [Phycisphaerae bacterium]
MEYRVQRAKVCPELGGLWDGPAWGEVEAITVGSFRPESSNHRPVVQAKLLFDATTIYGIFLVKDKYVSCVNTGFQEPVWGDSCVEFFVKPKPDKGHFNFEMNCGGALLAYYITDVRPAKTPTGYHTAVKLTPEEGRRVRIFHSLPSRVVPELQEETTWVNEFAIPIDLLEKHVGNLGDIPAQTWRANFYKCGDNTSHPHWASWSPVTKLDFHLPECFGVLRFEK